MMGRSWRFAPAEKVPLSHLMTLLAEKLLVDHTSNGSQRSNVAADAS